MLLLHHNFSLVNYKIKNNNYFNFEEFYKAHSIIDPYWLQWFIGFTEGDGVFNNK